jgi:actin-like ATPase involved in cell morphogenesis
LFSVESQIIMTSQVFFGLDDIIHEFEYRFGITRKDAVKLLQSYMSFCTSVIPHTDPYANNSFTIVQKKYTTRGGAYTEQTKKISENTISLVISYMISQMIEKVKSSIIGYLKSDISDIQVVLMGGGAYLKEAEHEFKEKFGCEIIIGENKLKSGGDLFGTAYGLLRYGIHERRLLQKEGSVSLIRRIKETFVSLTSWGALRLT